MVTQEEWLNVGATPINMEQMDALIAQSVEAWEKYDVAKKASSELFALAEEVDAKILAALKAAGKSKYYVDGLGTMGITQREIVTVPKTIEAKRKLFDYLREIGEEFFYSMLTVNSNTLNSWYNAKSEEAAEKGTLGFLVPGVDQPTMRETLRFNKERGKK